MAATQSQIDNLVALLDGYVQKGGHHLNVNVLPWELKVFLDMLEAYKFITPTAQTRYVEGLNSAFEGRRKQKK